jgi:D-amino-acid dehydrogenase
MKYNIIERNYTKKVFAMKNYIVIGGGILGASAAYHLAKEGVSVTLIDRQDPGQATAVAAGIICPWLSQRRNQAWYQLVKKGAAYYETLIRDLAHWGEMDTSYKKVGALSLHTDADKLEKIEERTRKRLEDAPEIGRVTRLSPEEAGTKFPVLAPEYAAVHVSGGARVNGRALRDALIRAAQKAGASVLYGSATLLYDKQLIRGVKVEEETLDADEVLVTAGAWANEVLAPLGVNFLVSHQKAQIAHLQLEENSTGEWPVVMPPNNQYLLAFENGQIVAGATHEDHPNWDLRVTVGGVNEVIGKAVAVAPGLSNATLTEVKVGFRPFTPGFLPVIGRVPGYSGLLIANGLGASGLTMGPYLGWQLAKIALHQPVDIDLSLYDVTHAIESPEL